MTDVPAAAPPGFDLRAALEEVALSTERFLTAAGGLSDAELRAPSRLPGWSRGHVVAHVARNADGMRNLVSWATTGVETPMYTSRETRDADIESGARLPAAELCADLRASAKRLQTELAGIQPEHLDRVVRLSSGVQLRAWELPSVRVREVEIHHVDLDAGYTPAHWSPDFAVRTLDQLAELFRTTRDTPVAALHGTGTDRTWRVGAAGPTLSGQESGLLAWLVGRSNGDGLTIEPHGAIPAAPAWT